MTRREVDEQLLSELGRAEPSLDEIELRSMALEAARAPQLHAQNGSSRSRWIAVLAATLVVGGTVGFGLSTWRTEDGGEGVKVAGLGFLPTPGWTVLQSEPASPVGSSTALASNVSLAAGEDASRLPYATLRRLPAPGLVIVARLSPRGEELVDAQFPVGKLPLRVSDAIPASVPSALAETSLVSARLRRSVAGYNVDVIVFFGTTPSPNLIAAVDRQLQRLVIGADGVTLVVSPRIVRLSDRLSLFGSVSSGRADEKVTIQFKQCGLRPLQFRDRFETTTREGGGYSLEQQLNLGVSGVFRALWRDSVSAEVHVQQRASVHIRARRGRFEVFVSALQQFWRRQVLLQRIDRRLGTWITFRTLVLTEQLGGGSGPAQPFQSTSPIATATEPFRLTLPKGTSIRAVFPLSQAKPCYLAGYSQIRRT